jgi:hypothetical protein
MWSAFPVLSIFQNMPRKSRESPNFCKNIDDSVILFADLTNRLDYSNNQKVEYSNIRKNFEYKHND